VGLPRSRVGLVLLACSPKAMSMAPGLVIDFHARRTRPFYQNRPRKRAKFFSFKLTIPRKHLPVDPSLADSGGSDSWHCHGPPFTA
jgi:hypothetical protein